MKIIDSEGNEIPFTGKIREKNGDLCYYKEGNLHREDGPAIENTDGDKSWYIKGKLHREDGPACEYSNGTKEWFKEGILHRIDGPAIERIHGRQEYFVNGIEIEFTDFINHLASDQDIFIGVENGYAKFFNSNGVVEIYCAFFVKEIEKEIAKVEKLKTVLKLLQTKEIK